VVVFIYMVIVVFTSINKIKLMTIAAIWCHKLETKSTTVTNVGKHASKSDIKTSSK